MEEIKVLCVICHEHILLADKTLSCENGLAHVDCYWGDDNYPDEDSGEMSDLNFGRTHDD